VASARLLVILVVWYAPSARLLGLTMRLLLYSVDLVLVAVCFVPLLLLLLRLLPLLPLLLLLLVPHLHHMQELIG
jgi:hypothetical protein